MNPSTYPAFSVLLVDDEAAWLRTLSMVLERSASVTNVLTCQDSRQVLDILAHQNVGVVVLDLTMPHLSGEELLGAIASNHPRVAAIVVSGQNQLDTAVRCMKLGAFDYFVKTAEEDRLVKGVARAIRMQELQREHEEIASHFFSSSLEHPEVFAEVVTRDRTMQTIFTYVEAVARSPQPLLIQGESGVGKELIARAAHSLSGCKGQLVTVNVAGIDDTVFADTLFGHGRGAFTGADQPRSGVVEEAAGGTLFLDEIGDLSLASQVKLLRLVQEGEYHPLGSDRPKRVKVRIIVATHEDLAARQQAGQFRRDLYFRLCAHRVRIPPLRERKDDIPLLLEHFLEEASTSLGKKKPTAPKELAQLLSTYPFPGNVRELRSMVFDAVSLHKQRVLSMESFRKAMGRGEDGPPIPADDSPARNPFAGLERLPTFREALELLTEEALTRASGNQTIASRLIGISQPALSKRLKLLRGEGRPPPPKLCRPPGQ